MRKKTLLGKIATKALAFALLLSSVSLAGCYKDEGLDVVRPGDGSQVITDAAYSISGSVTDIETGAPVELQSVVATVGEAKVLSNGAYHVGLAKKDVPENGVTVNLTFKAEGYADAVRSVLVEQIEDGSTIVYPLSVSMKKQSTPVNYVDVVYDLKFVVKNAETGEAIDGIVPTIEGAAADVNGHYSAGEYLVKTSAVEGKYYSSVTALSLPAAKVEEGKNNVRTSVVEIKVKPVAETPDPEKTYINISGIVVDRNGKALKAESIALENTDQKVVNSSEFRFTVLKEDKNYTVAATIGGTTVKSTSINANGGSYDCVLVFEGIGDDDADVRLPYVLDVNVIDAETKSAISNATYTINGAAASATYDAGIYTIKAVADGYYDATVKVALEVVYGKEGDKVYRVVTVEMKKVQDVKPEEEFITVYGEVVDSRGVLANAQIVGLQGANVENKYNVSNFSFTIKRNDVSKYVLFAEVLKADNSGVNRIKSAVNIADADAYYVMLRFPFVVENGKEVIEEGGGATGTLSPEIENGVVKEDVTNIMSDGTTILLSEGTQTNLGDQTLVLVRNTAEEENPTGSSAVIRSYVGLPDGTTFNPGLKVMFADSYAGQLGDSFELQYMGNDGTWAADNQGGTVSYANNVYTMTVNHFSSFRAALNIKPEVNVETIKTTDVLTIDRMNNSESALVDFKLTYNGLAGSIFTDYAKLEADVKAAFSNEKAQAVVLSAIKGLCPDVTTEYVEKEYVGIATIPAWTLLDSADIITTKNVTTYTITVNGKSISFTVETIASVEVSVTEKNMTHIGHSHGHGHGHGDLNNAGGGIIVNE